MKTKDLKQGSVFYFPYLWKWQDEEGISDSKERSCCLAFEAISPAGEHVLMILPISDQKDDGDNCIEISPYEKSLAGLDSTRPAYVHVAEYNLDPLKGSVVRRHPPHILGRFSEVFTRKISSALAQSMRHKTTFRVDRRN
jgi:hypothetical protein